MRPFPTFPGIAEEAAATSSGSSRSSFLGGVGGRHVSSFTAASGSSTTNVESTLFVESAGASAASC